MTLSDRAVRQLKLLLPMLTSDKDGEVVNAARKIVGILFAEGKDVHDLVAMLTAEPTVIYRNVFREQSRQAESHADPDWIEIIEFCCRHADSLMPREVEFVRDMQGKIRRWGDPTEKQAAWLTSIHDKLRRRYGQTA